MDLIDWAIGHFGNDWLRLLKQRMNILINILGTVDL